MRVLVDMSATLIHHGHIRLLKKAAELGTVIVALTDDEEIKLAKGYMPELKYEEREEILCSIKYVDEVVKSKWLIDNEFMNEHKIDKLVHGCDNRNTVDTDKVVIYERTGGISSSELRKRACEIVSMSR